MKNHLVLIPGLVCDETVWRDQVPVLSELADITIADHKQIDSLGGMAEAILANAPERFAVAGHSMGGRVALEIFRRAPQRVRGIAIMDSKYTPLAAGAAGDQEAAARHALVDKARKEGMRAMAVQWSRPMVHPDRLSDAPLMNAILDMVERKTPDIFAAQIKALLERPDAGPLLPQIQCPSLVLCGRQDSWSGLSDHETMAAMIPHTQIAWIEDCGHMSTMERPAEVTAAMREWLTKVDTFGK
jgi:pimeloyl-ACP methyl ester carboxylesterase